jgi:hypothetical protein
MYFYHRLPASPDWRRRLATPEDVAAHLGTAPGQPGFSALERDWSPVVLAPPYDGWQMWRRRREHEREKAVVDTPIAYKLYVSPRTEVLAEAFAATCDAALEANAPRFKVGKDVYGLLRPDKVVVYFSRFEDLQAATDRLHRRLAGCPAHGVPFTAELDCEGLLSWGTDPPRDAQMLDWQERESWRLWLTNRLATALVAARTSRLRNVEPWRFALERVRLEGVDTRTWTPDPAIWGTDATVSVRESALVPSARPRAEHPDADHR